MESQMSAGYGIAHTLEETAQLLGITRERVRQIEKRALEKLRIQLRIGAIMIYRTSCKTSQLRASGTLAPTTWPNFG